MCNINNPRCICCEYFFTPIPFVASGVISNLGAGPATPSYLTTRVLTEARPKEAVKTVRHQLT